MGKILCVNSESLTRAGRFQGFVPWEPTGRTIWSSVAQPENLGWVERAKAEDDPSWKQVIPVVVVQCIDDIHEDVLSYRRAGNEGRLHAFTSILWGGHVDEEDAPEHVAKEGVRAILPAAVRREIGEELGLGSDFYTEKIGLVNEDDSNVGRVHLGLVHRLWVRHHELNAMTINEGKNPAWVPVRREMDSATHRVVVERMEPWSKFAWTYLLTKIGS